jgi:uncharacterized protein YrrD
MTTPRSASLLVRATDLHALPVVTTSTGEAIAETRDVIDVPDAGCVVGFTLTKRGLLAGRLKQVLGMSQVHAVGRDAVMVQDAGALDASDADVDAHAAKGRNVIGNAVLTDTGRQLGTVRDLIVELNSGEVIGYELAGDPGLQRAEGAPLLLPLPATLAVSGDVLMVPADVEEYIRDDLAGFGSAVDDFRARIAGGGTPDQGADAGGADASV